MDFRFNLKRRIPGRGFGAVALAAILITASTRLRAETGATGSCGGANVTVPFTDVPATNIFFCSIAAAYFSGLTNGTSATTYSPPAAVPREQMAAFVSRTLDQSLRRGSRRAALKQFGVPRNSFGLPSTVVGDGPTAVECDGADLWVVNHGSNTISRVRASDGRLLETWTGASDAESVLVARGRIYVATGIDGGKLYVINPAQPAGAMTLLTQGFGFAQVDAMASDGDSVWLTQESTGLHKISFSLFCSPCVSTYTDGFANLRGILYDGANIWVTDFGSNCLHKISDDGTIALSLNVGGQPYFPVFDGMNSVTVVRVKDADGNPLAAPFRIATLTGNGLNGPLSAAFDGERILITNSGGVTVSLWRATDLTPLGSVLVGGTPQGACSDGLNFWITLENINRLARF